MTLIGLSKQRIETEIRFLDMEEKNKGVGREVREKEPMLAIDKPKSSPIITLSEAVYNA